MEEEFIVMRKSEYGAYARHTIEVSARKEAERLAVKENDEFLVVEILGRVKPNNVVWDNAQGAA